MTRFACRLSFREALCLMPAACTGMQEFQGVISNQFVHLYLSVHLCDSICHADRLEIEQIDCGWVQTWLSPNMEIGETLYVTTPADFRKWLKANHGTRKEIWLVQYKKATGKPSIKYLDAVEEAICFGWIDGFEKGIDAERYATRFTPRRPKSNWTETNKERARRLIAEGRMTKAGLASLPPDMQGHQED